MNIEQSVLLEIVRRILNVSKPDKIILFGSAATGKLTVDSDIDLLIVEQNLVNRREEYLRIRRALGGMGYSFDIILISSEWFKESKDIVGGIAYPASKYGKVLYDAA